MGRQVPIRAGVGASGPTKGGFPATKLSPADASRGAFRSPPCTPFGSPLEAIKRTIGLQALLPRRSRRVNPHQGEFLAAKLSLIDASRGLSLGQTIGAVRTAVRPACCLPELRVANRLRRLYPLDTRFPSFPPAPLRTVVGEKTHKGFPRGNPSVQPPPYRALR